MNYKDIQNTQNKKQTKIAPIFLPNEVVYLNKLSDHLNKELEAINSNLNFLRVKYEALDEDSHYYVTLSRMMIISIRRLAERRKIIKRRLEQLQSQQKIKNKTVYKCNFA